MSKKHPPLFDLARLAPNATETNIQQASKASALASPMSLSDALAPILTLPPEERAQRLRVARLAWEELGKKLYENTDVDEREAIRRFQVSASRW